MAQRTSPVPRNRRHVASMALTAATPRRNGIHRVPPLLLFGPSCVIGSACLAWWWNVEGGSSYDDDVGGAHVSACEVLAAAGGDGSGGGAVPMKDGDGRWDDDDDDDIATLWAQAKRAMRMVRRLVKLLLVLSPVLALYPLHLALCRGYGGDRGAAAADAQDVVLDSLEHGGVPPGPLGWYYRVCLVCVEWSGAACIKLMQWAGSRPDMFGQDFCAVFSQLQDDTTPHAWKHTERALVEAYGTNWEDRVRLDHILGSGCIAQVYKGTVWGEDGTERPVAVKVMHPNVEEDIDADLDLMRLSVRILEWLDFGPIRNLRWLNLPGIIEEMATMLKIQLDLTTEGEHLVKFNRNFRENEMITFPELVEGFSPTKRVLVETYCPGVPIMDYIRTNRADRSLLSTMCEAAIKAVCQMIFLDNFMVRAKPRCRSLVCCGRCGRTHRVLWIARLTPRDCRCLSLPFVSLSNVVGVSPAWRPASWQRVGVGGQQVCPPGRGDRHPTLRGGSPVTLGRVGGLHPVRRPKSGQTDDRRQQRQAQIGG